ncbi:hypothetical protein CC86DRAFT_39545 [Ophiobolus disseminans]|uniref:Uncharacterized protein n=1 Tax=Ophiobolus disseminans TaxID=1469910 RepID=A0A6A6ZWD6_9PLEO|nr:hypothetical protein CC86DRAFT_39545 [Ophiobolus disseminans]
MMPNSHRNYCHIRPSSLTSKYCGKFRRSWLTCRCFACHPKSISLWTSNDGQLSWLFLMCTLPILALLWILVECVVHSTIPSSSARMQAPYDENDQTG